MDESIFKIIFFALIVGASWLFQKMSKPVDERDELTEEDLEEFRRQDRAMEALERAREEEEERRIKAEMLESSRANRAPNKQKSAQARALRNSETSIKEDASHDFEASTLENIENSAAKIEKLLNDFNELKNRQKSAECAYSVSSAMSAPASAKAYELAEGGNLKNREMIRVLNLNSASDLRRAFLVSEILSRPLALRKDFADSSLGIQK